MHTITMLGMKGGTGRTTLTMALASAFTAKGRRVLVVDGTETGPGTGPRGIGGPLDHWLKTLRADGLPEDALEIEGVVDDGALGDLLARAGRRGIDVALIDTSGRRTSRLAACLEAADLVLTPFTGRREAECALDRVELPERRLPLFGVACGLPASGRDRETAVAALGAPVLRSALPRAELFASMPVSRRLDRIVAAFDERAHGTAAAIATRQAWAAALDLAAEVDWLLEGLALAPYDPDPVRALCVPAA